MLLRDFDVVWFVRGSGTNPPKRRAYMLDARKVVEELVTDRVFVCCWSSLIYVFNLIID